MLFILWMALHIHEYVFLLFLLSIPQIFPLSQKKINLVDFVRVYSDASVVIDQPDILVYIYNGSGASLLLRMKKTDLFYGS